MVDAQWSTQQLFVSCRNVALRCDLAKLRVMPMPSQTPNGSEEVQWMLHNLAEPSGVFAEGETLIVLDAQEDRMWVR